MHITSLSALLLLPFIFSIALPAQANGQTTNTGIEKTSPVSSSQLRKLVDEYFQQDLALNPLNAPAYGVNSSNAKFGDYLSDNYLQAQQALEKKYLNLVQAINRSTLSSDDKISYDAFIYGREMTLKSFDYPFWYLPLNQEVNKANDLAMQASGDLIFPFNSTQNYDDFLSRLDGLSLWIDHAIICMQKGSTKGIALPKEIANATADQIQNLIVANPRQSEYYKPILRLPATIPQTEKKRLASAYQQKIRNVVNPALSRLERFLRKDYQTRTTIGWHQLPNGENWYQYLSQQQTTSDLSVDEIFTTGEREVARILSEMDAIRREVGFKGDLKAFFKALLHDPKYQWRNRQAQMATFHHINERVEKALPALFSLRPKTELKIKPIPPAREKTDGGAWYSAGSADGKTPGVFFINTKPGFGLYKWEMEANFVHEVSPGHHFQISLKQEQQNVPKFRQYMAHNGFEEGWALYVESIAQELGLLNDPLQRFGRLNNEMLRALRLVVEPGLHTKGWTIEQAQQYMLDRSALTPDYVQYEVLRYLANPGQALSYKVGQLSISKLRRDASATLGTNFDLRSFHDNVINSGTLPLAVLDKKMKNWVATQQ
ncbi:DUF885 domain-containing protein [Craterilacuibacter sp. RT1T]|uniref:DUF885 domain-containing protein n=1 Tax=Craterilacuibacter sp. RT1T TaxID=2942211 RepID=UPI0020BF11BD|nr:DUF885 domain-containing protein [Craterilacuibacter sp. RT1T]MCL6264345.1 DUF885 domain-containing protein [Craterilacuibacter sp. RT1T]